jgi:sec-independent protein translocase protein TatA
MGLDNPIHIAVIVVLLLLLFGAKRLPEIGRSLGSGMREFKQAVTGDGGATQGGAQPTLTPAAQQPPQASVVPPATAQAPAAAPAQAPAEPTTQA